MAYPTSHPSSPPSSHASGQGRSSQAFAAPGQGHNHRSLTRPDGEHQLEKLQFALAVALTRGDLDRSQQLRDAIAALGGNQEEPGT